MSPIICRWKLVKHLDCFGDNKRTKDYQNDHQVISMLLVKQQKIMLKILLVRMPLFWAVVRIMGTCLYPSSLIEFTAFFTTEFQKNKREVERFELHSKLFSSAWKLPILSIKLKYPGFCCLFASLTLTCIRKLPFIQRILLETKMTPLISQIRCLPFWAPCSL